MPNIMVFPVNFDVAQSTGKEAGKLSEQLDRLAAEGYREDDMIVFPISLGSGALSEIARVPGIVIDWIGPDVVRVRRGKVT